MGDASIEDVLHRLAYGRDPENEAGAGPMCGDGCLSFRRLADEDLEMYGVCANPKSPRVGRLTHVRQGCSEFEFNPDHAIVLRDGIRIQGNA